MIRVTPKTTTAEFSRGATTAQTDDVNASTIQVASVNSTNSSSPWTQNIINLPNIANGDGFSMQLTGQGVMAPSSAAGAELLYSTDNVVPAGAKIDTANFVTADAVSDWSRIRTVALVTGTMGTDDIALATLPVEISGINNVANQTTVAFHGTFLGEQDGKTVAYDQPMAAKVVQTTTLTTKYVQQLADGTQIPIRDPQTVEVGIGDDYTTAPLASLDVPKGYELTATPDNAAGVAGDEPITVTYIYQGAAETVIVPVVDATGLTEDEWTAQRGTLKHVAVYTSDGKTGDSYTIQVTLPSGYILASGDWTNGSFDQGALGGTYDDDPSTTQFYYVYVKKAQTKTVQERIQYKFNGGGRDGKMAAEPVYSTITFTLTGDGQWRPDVPSFKAQPSPKVPGYTADQDLIPEQTPTGDNKTGDFDYTVYYTPHEQKVHIHYIDVGASAKTKDFEPTDGTEVASAEQTLTGLSDDEYHNTIVVPDGYTLAYGPAKTDVPIDYTNASVDLKATEGWYDADDTVDQDYYVYLHQAIPATPDDPHDIDPAVVTHVVTETIMYNYVNFADDGTFESLGDTAAPNYVAHLTFKRSGLEDLATKKFINTGDWIAEDGLTFPAVKSPTIPGYTALTETVEAETVDPAKFDVFDAVGLSNDLQTIVLYVPNGSKTVSEAVHYVDGDGQTVAPDHTDEVAFTSIPVVPKGTATVTYPTWVAKNDDTTFDAVDSPVITGMFTTDKTVAAVTGLTADHQNIEKTVVYHKLGAWNPNLPNVPAIPYPNDPANPAQPEDPTAPNYPSIPYVPGYTPHDPNGDPLQPVDPSDPHKGYIPPTVPNDPETNTPITYVADGQKAIINYVDDDNAGAVVKADTLTGDSKGTNNYTNVKAANDGGFIALGYIVGDDDLPDGDLIVFDTDDATDQTYTVHLTHKTVPVTPTQPGNPGQPIDPNGEPKWPNGTDKAALDKVVHETVHYVYANGKTADADKTDSVEFTRTATVDEATGKVTYSDWASKDGDTTFDQKNSKVIAGYVADKASVAAVTGLTADSANVEDTVTYTKLGAWNPNLPNVPAIPYPNDPANPAQPEDPTAPNYPSIPYVPGYTPNDPNGDPLQPVDPSDPHKGYIPPTVPNDPGTDTPITYVADGQKAIVDYVDDDNAGAVVKTDTLTGDSDTTNNYSKVKAANDGGLIALGYVIGSDDLPQGDVITFDTDDATDQTYTVHLTHKTVPVTPDQPGQPGAPIDPNGEPKWPNGTDKAALDKVVHETVHYVYADGKTADADKTDSVEFTRTATVDEATGKVTYSDWASKDGDTTFDQKNSKVIAGYVADKASVAAVTGLTADSANVEDTVTYTKLGAWNPNLPNVPAIPYPNDPANPSQPEDPTAPNYPSIPYVPGYTPNDPNGDPLQPVDPSDPHKGYIPPTVPTDPGTDTPITYVADGQKAIVNYVDDDNAGAVVKTDTLTGDSDTTNNYSKVKAANDGGLIALGYVIGSDDLPQGDVITFDTDDATDQTYTVHLTHKTVPVTPDQPGQPGAPIDPNGKPKWPNGTDKANLDKVVHETVHYVYADGTTADADKTDSVEFTRTATVDEAAGKVTYTDWTAKDNDTTFDQKNSKVIAGYVADKASVAAVNGLTEESVDVEVTVTYTKLGAWNPNLPNVPETPYPNDPTDPSQPEDPTAPNYPSIPYVPGYTPNDPNGDPLQPVDPSDPHKGYIPPTVPNDPGTDTSITYVADGQKVIVNYVDDDNAGAVVKTDTLTGDSDTTNNYSKVKAANDGGFVALGYIIGNDDLPQGNVITFDEDVTTDQTYTVHLTHKTVPVTPSQPGNPGQPIDPNGKPKWPDGTDKASLNKVVHETVHYVYADGKLADADKTDSVEFIRTATVDEVTGKVTYTDWTAKDDDTTFDQKNSKVIAGYVADKASVAAVTGLTAASEDVEATVTYTKLGAWNPNLPNVPAIPYPNDPADPAQPEDPTAPNYPSIPYVPGYTPNDPNGDPLQPVDPSDPHKGYVPPVVPDVPTTDTNITYTPDDQLLNVVYLDNTTHQWLATDHDNGGSGAKSAYSTKAKIAAYEADGYQLISDSDGFPAGGVTFDDDTTKAQTYVVNLAHATVPATPAQPGVPGQPIDPTDPNGPTWPKGTDKASLDKVITEVVHYVYADGSKAAADHTDQVEFTRTATVDEVTGAVTYTGWTAKDNDTTFDGVESPVITGYLSDKPRVEAVKGLTPDSNNVEVTVTYTKLGAWTPNIPGVPAIPYPNDPNKPSQPATPTATNYPTIPYVPNQTPQGPDGKPLVPVDPDDETKGYIPPTPGDPSANTPITYVPTTTTSETPARPQLPDTSRETPTTPSATPQTPAASSQTRPTRPQLPATNGESPSDVAVAAKKAARPQLPKTGDKAQSWLATLGLSLVAILGLGAGKRRRDEK